MKPILLCLLSMITMLTLPSCKKSNPVGPSADHQIWPFEAGNTWVYLDSLFDTTGATQNVFDQTIAVSTDSVVGGETWYHLSGDSRFYTNKSDGLWVMWITSSSSVQTILFKYPCSVGDIWNYAGDEVVVKSTDTILTVPKGTFSCYKYLIQYKSQPVQYCYLSPGIGIVQIDNYLTTNSGLVYRNYRSQLESVTIK